MATAQVMTQHVAIEPGRPVELPSGDFIANAQMTREGTDLHLTGPGGHEIIINGYFAQETPPDLITADGSRLSPQMVDAFVPPEHIGQYAANNVSMNDASAAGQITDVTGTATIVHADGTRSPATAGAAVFEGDVIETSKAGAVNIQFADNTTFAISESARMSVDKFIYDNANQSGSSFFSMLQGVFVYTSGLIGKADPGSVNIDTPVGSIGIRGTVVAGQIAPSGQESKITILDGAIALTNGSGTHEMHNSFGTVSLNSYQSQPHDMGRMDAHTFQQSFQSVFAVAGETFSQFSAGAPARGNDSRGNEGREENNGHGLKGEDHGPQDGATNDPAQGAAPPPAGGPMPPAAAVDHGVMNAMPPGAMPPGAAMMPGAMPPGAPMPAAMGPMDPAAMGMMTGTAAGMMGAAGMAMAGMPGMMIGPAGMYGAAMPGMFGPAGAFGAFGPAGPYYGAAGPYYGAVGPYYGAAPLNPLPPPPPTGSTAPAGSFTLGFNFSPEYNNTDMFPGGIGMREFGPAHMKVGNVIAHNFAGPITYNIAVNGANLPQRIVTFDGSKTDISIAPSLTANVSNLIFGNIVANEQFTLDVNGHTETFTITAGKTLSSLVADINASGWFHAEVGPGDKLEVSTTPLNSGNALTIADVAGSGITLELFNIASGTSLPVNPDFILNNINYASAFSINPVDGSIYVEDAALLSHFANPTGINLTITATDSLNRTFVLNQHLDIRDYQPGVEPIITTVNTAGTSGADFLVAKGSAGITLDGAGGNDVIIGNTGNNIIEVDGTFKFVDGSLGSDKLSFTTGGAQIYFDFLNPSLGSVRNIETINLGLANGGIDGNRVKLSILDIFDMTGPAHYLTILQESGTADNSRVDLILNDEGHTMSLVSGSLSATPSNVTYQGTYNGSTVTLVIQGAVSGAAVDNNEVQVVAA